jgi:hypothetical protein
MTRVAAILEADLQAAVIDLAHLYGWRIFHARPAQNARGNWRTPVSADGAGFPDLVMARKHEVVIVELKSQAGRLRPEQTEWLADLAAIDPTDRRLRTFVWRPSDWLAGTIAAALR